MAGVFVASDEFVSAADAQSTALGMPDVARVYVAHPIQDRTDDEIRVLADEVFERVVAEIVGAS
ncbi:MAG: hypothetical protein RIR49_2170 [Actinomycetota bacterium]